MESKSWVRGSCIGRGANATVNMGINLSNGDVFAVKSVNLSSCLHSQHQALENEIRILKSISSPFVVRYFGDDTTATFRNLHLEYMPRGTLADVGSSEYIESYTWCLVSALSYLHSIGITHCDVKGKNVLLGAFPGSAKLADFGCAIETPIKGNATRGSPLWMAPEALRGEYQGPESDVWSLGCTVVEMVTGKPAWDADGAELLRRIGWSNELPVLPSGFSRLGVDFLDKCFRKDYKERWSCDELLCHPFVSAFSRKDTVCYLSPRCVLDGFNMHFDEGHDDLVEFDENLNFSAKQRLSTLVSRTGVNCEMSDGWVEVRGGEVTYSAECYEMGMVKDETQEMESSSTSSTRPLLIDERCFSLVSHDVHSYHDVMQICCNVDYRNDFVVSSKC